MATKIAAQLYTIREHTKTAADFARSLETISKIGYRAVQLSAVGCMAGDRPEVSAVQARKLLDDNGLACIATHRSWDQLVNATEAEIDFHRTVGCAFAAIGGLPPAYRQGKAAGYRSFIAESRPTLLKLKAAGIAFGYHNHAHEFERSGEGRKTLYDIFLDEADDLIQLEVDLYWVDHAGVNPERIAERARGRMPVIHLKDKEVVDPDGPVMAAIGEGNLDWKHLIPACEAAGVRWYAVEQDVCRRDPFDCLRSSYEFLAGFGL
jgi:sugar phosphate isomerase/epimerase